MKDQGIFSRLISHTALLPVVNGIRGTRQAAVKLLRKPHLSLTGAPNEKPERPL